MVSFILLALAPSYLFQFVYSQSCSPINGIQLTFYGYPDANSDTTSFGCQGTQQLPLSQSGTAGGSGTYQDPETFATAQTSTNFQPCEIVYVPYFKKYFRYMDHCTGCDDNHIDLWIGTSTSGGQTQIDCEKSFGSVAAQTVIRNPPGNLPTVSSPLWDGTCHQIEGTTFFSNPDTSSICSGSSNGGSSGGGPSAPAPSAPSPSSSTRPVVVPSSSSPTTTTSTALPLAPIPSAGPLGSVKQNQFKAFAPAAQQFKPTTLVTSVMMNTIGTSSALSTGSASGCSWPGHCIGAPCQSFNDCAGQWICIRGMCHDNLTDK